MDELEKTINDLLDRIKKQGGSASDSQGSKPVEWNGPREAKEREASELIRRAIKRLKSL
jgi:hypothetical protein